MYEALNTHFTARKLPETVNSNQDMSASASMAHCRRSRTRLQENCTLTNIATAAATTNAAADLHLRKQSEPRVVHRKRRSCCQLPTSLHTILEDEEDVPVRPPTKQSVLSTSYNQRQACSRNSARRSTGDSAWRLITENPIFRSLVTDELSRRDAADARIAQLASPKHRAHLHSIELERRLDWAKKIVIAYPLETGVLFEKMTEGKKAGAGVGAGAGTSSSTSSTSAKPKTDFVGVAV